MQETDDTIVAAATPPGSGGVGIVRLSGAKAREIGERMFLSRASRFVAFRPYTLHRGYLLDAQGERLDDGLVVLMPAPGSFTGEDVFEFHCHGGTVLVRTLVASCQALGARLADRGEFSRRALVNGRMDLAQAEAVAEMIAAPSREALRYGVAKLDGLLGERIRILRESLEILRMQLCVAVDFPDEDVECLSPEDFIHAVEEVMEKTQALLAGYERARMFRHGAQAVLAGGVNVGKSSLLNALLGRQRALVTDVPGTTRDFLEETLELDGLPVCLVDTAGLRETEEQIEEMGVALSRERMRQADVIVLVVDGGVGLDAAATEILQEWETLHSTDAVKVPLLLVWNKMDLGIPAAFPPAWSMRASEFICVSAQTGEGVDALAKTLKDLILHSQHDAPQENIAPNARQAAALHEAQKELATLVVDIRCGQAYDVCAVRLDTAAAFLGDVVGLDSSAEVLDRVFSTFCIGK